MLLKYNVTVYSSVRCSIILKVMRTNYFSIEKIADKLLFRFFFFNNYFKFLRSLEKSATHVSPLTL